MYKKIVCSALFAALLGVCGISKAQTPPVSKQALRPAMDTGNPEKIKEAMLAIPKMTGNAATLVQLALKMFDSFDDKVLKRANWWDHLNEAYKKAATPQTINFLSAFENSKLEGIRNYIAKTVAKTEKNLSDADKERLEAKVKEYRKNVVKQKDILQNVIEILGHPRNNEMISAIGDLVTNRAAKEIFVSIGGEFFHLVLSLTNHIRRLFAKLEEVSLFDTSHLVKRALR